MRSAPWSRDPTLHISQSKLHPSLFDFHRRASPDSGANSLLSRDTFHTSLLQIRPATSLTVEQSMTPQIAHSLSQDVNQNSPWPSSLKINSLFAISSSFFPLLRFLPPYMSFRQIRSMSQPRTSVRRRMSRDLGARVRRLTVMCRGAWWNRVE